MKLHERILRFLRAHLNVIVALWVLFLALGCGFIPLTELQEGALNPLHFSRNHYPYFHGEIVFSHEINAHKRIGCDTCHGESTTEEEIAAGDLPPMRTCFQCHDGVQFSRDCETCHQINRRERKPQFHTGSWLTHHKEMAHEEAYKCALCHQESECQQCHSTWKPRSHTLRFNRSTHGRMAIQDRRSCATCHETDFCENCHGQPPPDHTPSFRRFGGHAQVARIKLRSCLTCHRYDNVCAECHGAVR